jgi:hypothetical protein
MIIQTRVYVSNLKRLYQLETWPCCQINPGENRETVMDEYLYTADLLLLLISPAFMHSDYCYNKEMKPALLHHVSGNARALPIFLRSVHWRDASCSSIHMLPSVTCWHHRDDTFYATTLGIAEILQELSPGRDGSGSPKEISLKQLEGALRSYEQASRIVPKNLFPHTIGQVACSTGRRTEEAMEPVELSRFPLSQTLYNLEHVFLRGFSGGMCQ